MTLEIELTNASGGNAPLKPADVVGMRYQDTDRLNKMAGQGLRKFAANNGIDIAGGPDNFGYTVIARMKPGMFGVEVPSLVLAVTFTALPAGTPQ